jgi:hypothetical protein
LNLRQQILSALDNLRSHRIQYQQAGSGGGGNNNKIIKEMISPPIIIKVLTTAQKIALKKSKCKLLIIKYL